MARELGVRGSAGSKPYSRAQTYYLAGMSRKDKMNDAEGLYFLTFATVGWIDVLTRREYKVVVVESLRHCRERKGL